MAEDFSIKGFRPEDLNLGGLSGAESAGKAGEIKGPDSQEKDDEGKFGVAAQGISEDSMQAVDISNEDFDNMDFEDFDGMNGSANITNSESLSANQSSASPFDPEQINKKNVTA